jgi:hypothetical protein
VPERYKSTPKSIKTTFNYEDEPLVLILSEIKKIKKFPGLVPSLGKFRNKNTKCITFCELTSPLEQKFMMSSSKA